MQCGRIIVRGIVQGVGFRPFVYATAVRYGICGTVINHGSEVEITAWGDSDNFTKFCNELSVGPKMAVIDSIQILPIPETTPKPTDFKILPSHDGARSGCIPADIATCDACLSDILNPSSRYYGYWATSCTDCGPRYSIINSVPYDRERTSMNTFTPCSDCNIDYKNPSNRRHHAQTIACSSCGPTLSLLKGNGDQIQTDDPIAMTAKLLDEGLIVAIRGIGGFHICCVEETAVKLKTLLGRPHQSLAVMMLPNSLKEYVVYPSDTELDMLTGSIHPIMILDKLDPKAHYDLSELHNLGVMLPYTGLHHLLFQHLKHPLIIMTSANAPGTPMITETRSIIENMSDVVDYILTHNRPIVNRCDDSVVREGYLIRLSRGIAPLRTAIDLGKSQILGVGPELNANITVYKDGFTVTSPHIGNIRNPTTVSYLEETVNKITDLLASHPNIIAHDLHPQFLSTRLAQELAEEYDARLCPVQHHCAHIASVTTDEVVGIAIDGVGYGSDGTIWGGEILVGSPSIGYKRTGHLESVVMPGGDLATKYPERMLYGFLPDEITEDIFIKRGWDPLELNILVQQTKKRFNCPETTSTGRVLDAVSALLGICKERTYDGEPSMMLEAVATHGTVLPMNNLTLSKDSQGLDILCTSELLNESRSMLSNGVAVPDIAASFQVALAKGIAELAIRSAEKTGIHKVALSGGVAINKTIRDTIIAELSKVEIPCILNSKYPFGDGCISYGQVITAGMLDMEGKL